MITREIRYGSPRRGPIGGDLPADLAGKITVGTAHRLQGAERPIILFSAVYGTGSAQAGFIDVNPELMNVAVSRAKDLLVVFAAPNRWNTGRVFSVMSRFAQRAAVEMPAAEDAGEEALTVEADDQRNDTVQAEGQRIEGEPAEDQSVEEHVVAVEAAATTAQGTLSVVIRAWKDAGVLHEEDAGLIAADLNSRLAAAGVLTGRPGVGTHSARRPAGRGGGRADQDRRLHVRLPRIHAGRPGAAAAALSRWPPLSESRAQT